MADKEALLPKSQWTFGAISDIIDAIDNRFSPKGNIVLFGHSAGAQFVHRYILLAPMDQRISQIIIANAGWYTMPDESISFPYGIKNISLNDADLRADFSKPVIILLGEEDTHSDSTVLRHNEEVDRQGTNRFERGISFYQEAKKKAEALHVPFVWQLVTVPGVGHDDVQMAANAAKIISK